MVKLRLQRVRSALVRECMAEFLGTFVLLVSCFNLSNKLIILSYLTKLYMKISTITFLILQFPFEII